MLLMTMKIVPHNKVFFVCFSQPATDFPTHQSSSMSNVMVFGEFECNVRLWVNLQLNKEEKCRGNYEKFEKLFAGDTFFDVLIFPLMSRRAKLRAPRDEFEFLGGKVMKIYSMVVNLRSLHNSLICKSVRFNYILKFIAIFHRIDNIVIYAGRIFRSNFTSFSSHAPTFLRHVVLIKRSRVMENSLSRETSLNESLLVEILL